MFKKHLSRFVGAAMLVGAGIVALSSTADAQTGTTVNGSVSALGKTCSWTNGTSTEAPPTTTTIEASSINPPGGNLSCSSGVTAALDNSPSVTFNDTAGTATANQISASVTYDGISCEYTATNAVLDRSGATRDYSGTTSASKSGGSFLCPSSVSLSSTLDFS
jgi:hypothetical protein